MIDNSNYAPFAIARREDGTRHELGRGAMGVTYKATDTQLGRVVALKVINATYIGNPIVRQRFLAEARAAAQLHHPNVASIFQLRAEGADVFFAMEFVEGETVEAYVKRRGPLPARLALRIIQQAAAGLGAANERGLIHRDIKPANLMLARPPALVADPDHEDDDGLLVKVIDFGLAKNVSADVSSAGLTGDGGVGTPSYMSPEQIAPEAGLMLDARGDIYSLGVTLWYLLEGRTPFEGTPFQVLSQQLQTKPPIERLVARGVPRDVIAFLGTLMAKDREERPANYPALLSSLRKLLRTGGTTLFRLPGSLPTDSSWSEQTMVDPGALAATGLTSRVNLPSALPVVVPPKRKILRWAILGAVACLAVGIFFARPLLYRAIEKPAEAPPGALESEARRLVAKARDLLENQDDANRENLSLADDLCKRAIAFDPSDGEVWAASAQVSAQFIGLYYDRSPARYEALRTQAERAIKLAPESSEAALAQALYLSRGQTGALPLPEAERLLRRLNAFAPTDRRVLRALSYTLRMEGKFEEGVACLDRAIALPGGDPVMLLEKASVLLFAGRCAEAEVTLDQSLALRPLGRALLLKTYLALAWTGDLEQAREALARVPARLLLEDRGAAIASTVWLWRREPDKSIAVLNAVPRDILHDAFFTGPKAALTGLAQKMASRAEAAAHDWRAVLRSTEQRLASDPNDLVSLFQYAVALAELSQTPEADLVLQNYQQRGGVTDGSAPLGGTAGLEVLLGRHEAAIQQLGREVGDPRNFFITQAVLRLHPAFDAIRGDARFQAILARAAAPAAKDMPATPAN